MDANAAPSFPLWSQLCSTDFATLDPERTIAVLPVAAVEQHGPHLPLAVDAAILEGVMSAAAPHLSPDVTALALPMQAVGLSSEHQRFPGTLTLKPETMVRLWCELGECVARAGVRKLLLLNSHGGNVALLDIVGRELRSSCDLLVYGASWFNLPLFDPSGQDLNALFSPEEHRFGIHGGQIETSVMLALAPQLVRMEHAIHFHSTSQDRAQAYPLLGNGRSAKLAWQMQDYHPQGAVGNAAAATAEHGQALLDAAGRALATLLAELSSIPLSTLRDRPLV